jgi:hypothetical protein
MICWEDDSRLAFQEIPDFYGVSINITVLTRVYTERAEFNLHCRKPYFFNTHVNTILPSQPCEPFL